MYAERAKAGRAALETRVTAVLGPTNTGKTHYAIERMLAHRSGMIGLPLRLLAREVYDKIVRLKGAQHAALITGEEKIVPPQARYFVCTVEAMPLDIRVAFLAIDEIQLCADPERGHVFTDRLLRARGEEETVFLGADAMRGLIQKFIPHTYFMSRARFSDLAHTGSKKLTRLPRRSVVVGFSAEDVYGIAELIRRQRGGAAVVLGALSPRTRNAQVALYQSGEVDFLVATDAIGMGLNMDVDHVAFAALEKFDGVGIRPLRPEEVGQIAGRAGRHMNDGTFGTTAEAEAIDEEIVARVESHGYDALRMLQWRNADLDFGSLKSLIDTLDAPPPMRGLVKGRTASDLATLRTLSAQDDIVALASSRGALHRLWETCQLPDFRKLSLDDHARLVHAIYLHLMSDAGVLPDDWLAAQIARLDETEGDVATLSGRLAQIRTWTYASHRSGWTTDSAHWQAVTRAVEDRLSDALHERLTQRFIDRRTSVLMRRLRQDEPFGLTLDDSGGVSIDGESIGKLDGFCFSADARAEGIHGRTLRAATMQGLEGEFHARASRLSAAPDKDISLSEHGKLWWEGAVIARLVRGANPLAPRIQLLADDHLRKDLRETVEKRLDAWVEARIAAKLGPLLALQRAVVARPGASEALPAAARGIAHQICENFASLDTERVDLPDDIRPLRRALRPYELWFGRRSIYFPKLLKPDAASLLALLNAIWTGLEKLPSPPAPGLTSFIREANQPRAFLEAAGYRIVANRAIRLDMLERVEEELEKAAVAGVSAGVIGTKLVSLLGCDNESLGPILSALSWRRVAVVAEDGPPVEVLRRKFRKPQRRRTLERDGRAAEDSPFAELASLIAAR